MVYAIGLIILIAMGLGVKKNNDKLFMICSGLLIILIMGLRSSSVGTDSEMYLHLFKIISDGGITSLLEKAPLFTYVLKLVSNVLGYSCQIYFFTTAILVIVPLWIAIYISGIPVRKAVIVYYLLFFQSSLNGTRTFISVSLVVLSYVIARKKTKKSLILSIVILIAAFLIHKIAIIGLLVIGVSFINLEKKKVRRAVMLLTVIGCLSLNVFVSVFIKYFNVYADTLETVTDTVGASAIVFQGLMIISLLQTLYLMKKRKDAAGIIKKEDYDNMAVLLFAEVILFLAGGTTWYVQRILTYLEMFIIFLFPVLDKTHNKFRQVYRIVFYVFAGFLFCYGLIRNLNNVMPYTFFWQ